MRNANLAYRLGESSPSPIDLLPLARGASWRYTYAYSYYYVTDTVGTLRIQRHGTFGVDVRRESTDGLMRSFVVETSVNLDSSYRHEDTFHSGRFNDRFHRMHSRESHELVLLRDVLWYDLGARIEFMMPASFRSGGHVNLRLFDYPGFPDYPGRYNLFNGLLGPGRYTGGKYLYTSCPPGAGLEQRQALFSAAGEGLLELHSRSERRDDTVMSEKLDLELMEYSPGRLAW